MLLEASRLEELVSLEAGAEQGWGACGSWLVESSVPSRLFLCPIPHSRLLVLGFPGVRPVQSSGM